MTCLGSPQGSSGIRGGERFCGRTRACHSYLYCYISDQLRLLKGLQEKPQGEHLAVVQTEVAKKSRGGELGLRVLERAQDETCKSLPTHSCCLLLEAPLDCLSIPRIKPVLHIPACCFKKKKKGWSFGGSAALSIRTRSEASSLQMLGSRISNEAGWVSEKEAWLAGLPGQWLFGNGCARLVCAEARDRKKGEGARVPGFENRS